MRQPDKPNFRQLEQGFRQYWHKAPTIAGSTAVKFFKENFRRQGWPDDGRLERWRKRAPGAPRNRGRNILVDTGRLRRSIRTMYVSKEAVIVGTDVPYGKIHNEGGRVKKTVRVPGYRRKGHTRKAHTRAGKRIKRSKVRAASVESHSRKLDITLPKRQFIGESPDVLRSVERGLFRELDKMIKDI